MKIFNLNKRFLYNQTLDIYMKRGKIIKSTKLKFILTAILFFMPFVIQYLILSKRDNEAYGFPLPVIQRATYQCIIGGPCSEPHYVFNILFLIVDIIILYIITLLIIFILGNSKKKLKNNLAKLVLLTFILFILFTIISHVLSISYPSIKTMVGIGLPLTFYVYDTFGGKDIPQLFFPGYLIINLIYWFIIAVISLLLYNKLRYKQK